MAAEVLNLTAAALGQELSTGRVSAREVMAAALARAEALEPTLHACNSFDPEDALALAEASDARRRAGAPLGPLDGVPVMLKDNIAVSGQPLTCSSRMLANFVSPYDAHVTERLRAAGLVPWGRLNMDEFAMGSSTENSATGPTRNPWDPERVPGGSSGGSAAAVAARYSPLSLGSDTGGSIRQPAAYCGVVGLKPTYGRVSRYGLVAYASSLDQIGPLARTVEDCALLLDVMAGHDARDATSSRHPVPHFAASLSDSDSSVVRPWRIGLPQEYFGEGLSPAVREAVEGAARWFQGAGHVVVPVSLPRTGLAIPVYYTLAPAEASSNLARYDGVRYGYRAPGATSIEELMTESRTAGFGDEVKRRIILGTFALSSGYQDAYYQRAQAARQLIRDDFTAAFQQVDVLLTPTTQGTAFRLGEKTADPLAMYLDDVFTLNVNLAGLPALSLPCGFDAAGLPIGCQLIAPPFAEMTLLAVAHAFEQAHDFHLAQPGLLASSGGVARG